MRLSGIHCGSNIPSRFHARAEGARPGLLLSLLLIHSIFALVHAADPQPPIAPILRIETGMHTSIIWKMDVDAANRLAVTVSRDCSARVWDLRSGRLLRTLLMPGGEALNSVAITPDGRYVACGGWTLDGAIYLFETSTGYLARRITGLPSTPGHLVFSRNGAFLAATIYGNGVRVFRMSDFNVVLESKEGASTSFGADFDPSNRLVTCGGTVRLYDQQFHLKATCPYPGPNGPYAIRFSPDGSEVAVALSGADHVEVLSGKNLARLRSLNFPTGALAGVGWTPDGAWLFAGSIGLIRRWSREGAANDYPISGQVTCLQPLADGTGAYATGNPGWGKTADKNGNRLEVHASTAYFAAHVPPLAVSADGSAVQYSYAPGDPAVFRFDLHQRQIRASLPADAPPKLIPPRTTAPGLQITDYETGAEHPKLNGKPLMGPGGTSSLAIAPDEQSFAISGGWAVSCYDRQGAEKWRLAVSYASRVNFSRDGKLFIVAYTDGTIRWYRVSDRQELLAFFPSADRQRWVMWTPEGYYDCSPGAEDLIGWQMNRGNDQAPAFFSAGQFRNVYYRPDVIQKALKTLDVTTALHEADRERGLPETRPEQIGEVIARLSPPVVEIETGGVFGVVTLPAGATEAKVRYRVRQTGKEAPAEVTVRFNGRLVDAAAPLPRDGEAVELNVPVPAGMSGELSVFASHPLAVSEPATLRIERAPGKGYLRRPNLYLVAVGVARLKRNALPHSNDGSALKEGDIVLDDIPLADGDARNVAKSLTSQKGRLYAETRVQTLTNEQATVPALREALEKVAREAGPEDVAIVFFSGHGIADPKLGFYLATYEADPKAPAATALTGRELSRLLEGIKARTVLALDTCHSGGALGGARLQKVITSPNDLMGLINELSSAEQGAVVLSSSAASEQSLGDPKNGGVFTQAFCEALKNMAAANDADNVTCRGMQIWLSKRVPELVTALVKDAPQAPRQTPSLVIPKGVPDFPLAKPFESPPGASDEMARAPSRFRLLYNFDDPGYRTWNRTGLHWEEKLPSGRVKRFTYARRDAVDGRPGSVLHSMDEADLEIFVSDKAAPDPRLYFRKGQSVWGFLGRMENLE